MTEALGLTVELDLTFDAAVQRTREALKTEGFGIISEIDMRAAFKEKLGRDFRPYVILGACNPPLAFKALSADAEVGLLLPCNVTVEAASATTSVVRLVDPVRLLGTGALATLPEFAEVAGDARDRLRRVADALGRSAGG